MTVILTKPIKNKKTFAYVHAAGRAGAGDNPLTIFSWLFAIPFVLAVPKKWANVFG